MVLHLIYLKYTPYSIFGFSCLKVSILTTTDNIEKVCIIITKVPMVLYNKKYLLRCKLSLPTGQLLQV